MQILISPPRSSALRRLHRRGDGNRTFIFPLVVRHVVNCAISQKSLWLCKLKFSADIQKWLLFFFFFTLRCIIGGCLAVMGGRWGGGTEGLQERWTGVRFDPRQEDGQRFRGRWLMLLTAIQTHKHGGVSEQAWCPILGWHTSCHGNGRNQRWEGLAVFFSDELHNATWKIMNKISLF